MRLEPGTPAPPFATRDMDDRPIDLEHFRGERLMLSFYRYASCPLCNLRVHTLVERHGELASRGLRMLAVFQSPRESLRESMAGEEAPFPIIPDPSRSLYQKYGVERSWLGVLSGLFRWQFLAAWHRAGYRRGRPEGDLSMIPADFLIDPDLTISLAFYGRHIGDHLPLDRVFEWLKKPAEGQRRP